VDVDREVTAPWSASTTIRTLAPGEKATERTAIADQIE
jgi:hypothetical protein